MASGKRSPSSSPSESPPDSHGGGGDGITGGGRAAGSGSGEVRGDRLDGSDQIARRDPCPLLPGHGFGFEKEKSAGCHDGCVPREVHERLVACLLVLEDFMAGLRDSCKTSDGSKGEQHELRYGSLLSSRWGRKSGGGREPAGRFPYASWSSYTGPSSDFRFRAPPVPPSHARRARDIRKRSRSPTRGALPPKDSGGDPKMKRGRDDRHGPV